MHVFFLYFLFLEEKRFFFLNFCFNSVLFSDHDIFARVWFSFMMFIYGIHFTLAKSNCYVERFQPLFFSLCDKWLHFKKKKRKQIDHRNSLKKFFFFWYLWFVCVYMCPFHNNWKKVSISLIKISSFLLFCIVGRLRGSQSQFFLFGNFFKIFFLSLCYLILNPQCKFTHKSRVIIMRH